MKDRGRKAKAIWTRIGAAWPHGSGNGFTIELEAYPVGGRIVLTEPKAGDTGEQTPPSDTFEAAAKEAV